LARFLVLDWDHKQLHVVAADVGKGSVRIRRAEVWAEERTPNLAEAEALGQSLRERLKEAGIAAAPVLACVGRDRFIVKDFRIPAVPEHEEPALVRFQAIKELTDSPDEVVIDYTASPFQTGANDRRALTLIIRKELLDAYQNLCKAAGLKLAGVAPRPLGIVACLRRKMGTSPETPAPEPADRAVASVAVAENWAEFNVSRGETILFSRSLAVGPTLAGEIRRNLAVYAGQSPQQPVAALYLAGGAEHAAFRDRLQTTLGIPVHSFDPVAGADRLELPDGTRGGFAGAVGLLHAHSEPRGLPINFAHPKQPKPPPDPNRQRNLVAVLALIAVVAAGGLYAYSRIYLKDREVARARMLQAEYDNRQRLLEPDVKNFDAVQEWVAAAPVWLDELYDITAAYPDQYDRVRLSLWQGGSQQKNNADKDWVARIEMRGRASPNDLYLMDKFRNDLYLEAQHYRPEQVQRGAATRRGSRVGTVEFTLKVDDKKIPPAAHTRQIEIKPVRRGRGGDEFLLDGGFPGGNN
jgi:hypothetical protein